MEAPRRRPELGPSLTAEQLANWYWRRDELQQLARAVGVSAAGSKDVLTRRIHARLAGTAFTEPARTGRPPGAQLEAPLTPGTRIPQGQRCSQALRAWFVGQVGPAFHFDAAMRSYIGASDGNRTLGDAVDHWWATRDGGDRPIDRQFEFNRFTRDHHRHHPDATRADVLAAWARYRDQPVDRRGRI